MAFLQSIYCQFIIYLEINIDNIGWLMGGLRQFQAALIVKRNCRLIVCEAHETDKSN